MNDVLNKLHRQRNDAFNKKITLDIAKRVYGNT